MFPDDFQAWKVPMLSQRGHFSSVITLSLEALAKKAPDVSFIHEFPGSVKTNLARGGEGAAILVLKWVFKIIGPFINIPNQESGERHVFMATSARFVGNDRAASGVPLEGGLAVASGISGSSAYSIDWNGQASGPKVEALLGKLRADGTVEKVWRHTEGEFKRITGVESV